MRIASGIITALLLSTVLATSACSSAEAPDPTPDLFAEYARSTTVKGDRIHTTGSSEDRLAILAAYYTPDQLQSRLFSTFECTSPTLPASSSAGSFDTRCYLTNPVLDAVRRLGAAEDKVLGRSIVVKHADGRLELLTLFVAAGKVIDSNGDTYTDLNDFRAHNNLLTSDDLIRLPRNLTAVPGEGEVVTVYAHTPSPWWIRAAIAAGALLLLTAALLLTLRLKRHPATPTQTPPPLDNTTS